MIAKFAKLALPFALAVLVMPMFLGQSVTAAENVAPVPTPGTPSVLPRPDFHFPGNVGRTYRDSDPPQFPQPVQAPKRTQRAANLARRRGLRAIHHLRRDSAVTDNGPTRGGRTALQ